MMHESLFPSPSMVFVKLRASNNLGFAHVLTEGRIPFCAMVFRLRAVVSDTASKGMSIREYQYQDLSEVVQALRPFGFVLDARQLLAQSVDGTWRAVVDGAKGATTLTVFLPPE